MSKEQYPADEFDQVEGAGPRGLHRAPEPWWRWFAPFLIVLVLVPALAWGAMYLTSSPAPSEVPQAGSSKQLPTPENPVASVEEKQTPSAEAGAETSPPSTEEQAPVAQSPEAKPAPEVAVKKDAGIAVLNGSGVNGLAGRTQKKLQADGYTQVSAGNARGWASKVSVVYYSSDEMKATAEAVALLIGVENVRNNPQGNPGEIIVLLRRDFASR